MSVNRALSTALMVGLLTVLAAPAMAQLPFSVSGDHIQKRDTPTKGKNLDPIAVVFVATIPPQGASLELTCDAEAFNRGRGAKLRFITDAVVANPVTRVVIQDLGKVKVKTKKRTGTGSRRVNAISQSLTGQVAIVVGGRVKGGKKVDHAKLRCALDLS